MSDTTQETMAPKVVDQGTDTTGNTPTIKVKQKIQVVEKTQPVTLSFEDGLAELKKTGTVGQKSLIAALDQYRERMAPGKPVSDDDGAKYQYALWKTIQTTIDFSAVDEFKSLWALLLGYFNHYKKGALHDQYIYRFSEYWVYSLDDLDAFQRILNLILLTRDPSTREKGLRQQNFDRTLQLGLTEAGRQRLINFYH